MVNTAETCSMCWQEQLNFLRLTALSMYIFNTISFCKFESQLSKSSAHTPTAHTQTAHTQTSHTPTAHHNKCSVSPFFKSGVKIRLSRFLLTPDAGKSLSKQYSNTLLGSPQILTLNKSWCLSFCGLIQLYSIYLNHIYQLLSLQTQNIFSG